MSKSEMSKAQLRKKYGVMGSPIPATRVLVKPMDHDFGVPAHCLLVINDEEGTITAANVYGENLGKGYDPDSYTHPLPAEEDPKWKAYRKRGYEEGNVADWDVLEMVESQVPEVEAVKA